MPPWRPQKMKRSTEGTRRRHDTSAAVLDKAQFGCPSTRRGAMGASGTHGDPWAGHSLRGLGQSPTGPLSKLRSGLRVKAHSNQIHPRLTHRGHVHAVALPRLSAEPQPRLLSLTLRRAVTCRNSDYDQRPSQFLILPTARAGRSRRAMRFKGYSLARPITR